MSEAPEIRGFFDDQTNTITYLIWDPAGREPRSSTRCSISIPRAGTSTRDRQ